MPVKAIGKNGSAEVSESNQNIEQSVVPAAFRNLSHESDDLSVSLNESEFTGPTDELTKAKEIQDSNTSISDDSVKANNNCNGDDNIRIGKNNDISEIPLDNKPKVEQKQVTTENISEHQCRITESSDDGHSHEHTIVNLTQALRNRFDHGDLNTLTSEELLRVYGDLNVLISQVQHSLKTKMS